MQSPFSSIKLDFLPILKLFKVVLRDYHTSDFLAKTHGEQEGSWVETQHKKEKDL